MSKILVDNLDSLHVAARRFRQMKGFSKKEDFIAFLQRVVRTAASDRGVECDYEVTKEDALEYQEVLRGDWDALRFVNSLIRRGVDKRLKDAIHHTLFSP